METTDLQERATYKAAHRRIYQVRGPASAYPCIDCGDQAAQWAYDHQDPDELTDVIDRKGTIAPFSLDPMHYRPLCRSCHARADRGAACQRGHLFDGDNLAYDGMGYRLCLTCRRDRNRIAARRYKAKRRLERAGATR